MTQGGETKGKAADGNGLGFDAEFKAQVDAVSRDYILEPRLGESRKTSSPEREKERDKDTKAHRYCFDDDAYFFLLTFFSCSFFSCCYELESQTEYRTVSGVSGPLVIVENVKVRERTRSENEER